MATIKAYKKRNKQNENTLGILLQTEQELSPREKNTEFTCQHKVFAVVNNVAHDHWEECHILFGNCQLQLWWSAPLDQQITMSEP